MKSILLLISAFVLAAGLRRRKPGGSGHQLSVVLLRVTGSAATGSILQFLAPADGDPAFWEPSDSDIAETATRGQNPHQRRHLREVAGSRQRAGRAPRRHLGGLRGHYIEIKDSTTHSHGKAGAHSHSGTAFTTWLELRPSPPTGRVGPGRLARAPSRRDGGFAISGRGPLRRYRSTRPEMPPQSPRISESTAHRLPPGFIIAWDRRYGSNIQAASSGTEVVRTRPP